MKTIREWFDAEMPNDIKQIAFAIDGDSFGDIDWDCPRENFTKAVRSAFFWGQTQQGSYFWYLVSFRRFDEARQLLNK